MVLGKIKAGMFPAYVSEGGTIMLSFAQRRFLATCLALLLGFSVVTFLNTVLGPETGIRAMATWFLAVAMLTEIGAMITFNVLPAPRDPSTGAAVDWDSANPVHKPMMAELMRGVVVAALAAFLSGGGIFAMWRLSPSKEQAVWGIGTLIVITILLDIYAIWRVSRIRSS